MYTIFVVRLRLRCPVWFWRLQPFQSRESPTRPAPAAVNPSISGISNLSALGRHPPGARIILNGITEEVDRQRRGGGGNCVDLSGTSRRHRPGTQPDGKRAPAEPAEQNADLEEGESNALCNSKRNFVSAKRNEPVQGLYSRLYLL